MDEEIWWSRVIETLKGLPFTDDPFELFEVLRRTDYFKKRSGIPRPSAHSPERYAQAIHRLRYYAPEGARRAAREMNETLDTENRLR